MSKEYLVTVHRGAKAGRTYTCSTLRAASRKVDRLDREYGACCATYKRVATEQTTITLTRDSNSVTFARRGDRATMRNSRGEAALMTQEEAIARVHTLIDAGWRLVAEWQAV